MYWAERRRRRLRAAATPESTCFCLCIYEAPLPGPTGNVHHPIALREAASRDHAGSSKGRLPLPQQRARADRGAPRGFDNCLLRDMLGNVAELANANIFMARTASS